MSTKPLFSLDHLFFSPQRKHTVWWNVVIIAGVITLSFILAYIGSSRLDLLVGAAILAIPVVIAFLRWPPVGLAVLIFSSFLVPSPFGLQGAIGSMHTAILLTALLTGLWVLDMFVRQKRLYLAPSPTNAPLLILMLLSVIALINAQLNYYSVTRLATLFAQISGVAVFVLSGSAYLLAANQLKTQTWLEKVTWLYLAIGGFYILGRLTPLTERLIRPLFQYGSDASLFWTWLVALGASQALLNNKLKMGLRVALGALVLCTLFVSVIKYNDWKSGWLPALAALGVIVFIGMPRLRFLVVLGGLIVIYQTAIGSQLLTSNEDYSISTRWEAYRLVLEIVKANPILGLGISNYYWYTPLFPILGYAVNFNSHNNYIDILAQTGLVGLVVFLIFFSLVALLAWRLIEVTPSGFARAYSIGALGGLVGMMVAGMLGDWVLPFVYNVGMHGMRSSLPGWFFLGGLVLLEQLYLKKAPAG